MIAIETAVIRVKKLNINAVVDHINAIVPAITSRNVLAYPLGCGDYPGPAVSSIKPLLERADDFVEKMLL
jgi:hypothetical protein